MPTTKPWYASKTLWFNAVIGLSAVAGFVTGHPDLLGKVLHLDPNQAVAVLMIANAILRLTSNTKITLS